MQAKYELSTVAVQVTVCLVLKREKKSVPKISADAAREFRMSFVVSAPTK